MPEYEIPFLVGMVEYRGEQIIKIHYIPRLEDIIDRVENIAGVKEFIKFPTDCIVFVKVSPLFIGETIVKEIESLLNTAFLSQKKFIFEMISLKKFKDNQRQIIVFLEEEGQENSGILSCVGGIDLEFTKNGSNENEYSLEDIFSSLQTLIEVKL